MRKSRFTIRNHRAPKLTQEEYLAEWAESAVRQLRLYPNNVVTLPFVSNLWAYALEVKGWRE